MDKTMPVTVTSNLSTLDRLKQHRKKRRALLGFNLRLWKRRQDHYEVLDENAGERLKGGSDESDIQNSSIVMHKEQQQSNVIDAGESCLLAAPSGEHDEMIVNEIEENAMMTSTGCTETEMESLSEHGNDQSFTKESPRPVSPDLAEQASCVAMETDDEQPCDLHPNLPACDAIPMIAILAKPKIKKSLRFADDVGQPLSNIHYAETTYSQQDLLWTRAIVLLLNSKKRKFEFIHVSYNMEERTSIADILQELPDMATDEDLMSQNYTALCRTTEFGRELINSVSIQGYDLKRDEILVAIINGISGNSQLKTAKPLLENKKILRAVKKAKAHGRAVKRFATSSSKNEEKITRKSKVTPLPQDVVMNEDSVPDMSLPELSEEEENPREKYLRDDGNKDRVLVTRFLNAGVLALVAYSFSSMGSKGRKARPSMVC